MRDDSYPALFRCSDDASNRMQRTYLNLIRGEYAILLLAAILSMSVFSGTGFYIFYAALFVISIVLLLTRAFRKPEQDWYRCRALAESVKTSTWRYMMRAAPFEGVIADPRKEFRDHLYKIFDANRPTAEKIAPDWSAQAQITAAMDAVNAMSLDERKVFYVDCRIQEQRKWYVRKAKGNRRAIRWWVSVGVIAYATAGILSLTRIGFPDWNIWPIEPLIVFASSIIGWMQVKKFSELSAAYTVTAQEIGFISPTIEDAKTESEFSDAINEAELAFSREHTLWIARQTN